MLCRSAMLFGARALLIFAPLTGNAGAMDVNTLILGAGAAGMMAAAHCGPSTLLIDHAKAPGEKIRISDLLYGAQTVLKCVQTMT
jgi:hypothetical protein